MSRKAVGPAPKATGRGNAIATPHPADLVGLLVSPRAGAVTGTVYVIDGGTVPKTSRPRDRPGWATAVLWAQMATNQKRSSRTPSSRPTPRRCAPWWTSLVWRPPCYCLIAKRIVHSASICPCIADSFQSHR